MSGSDDRDLSARERQIMDALYRRGEATVAEIREDLPDPPTASAVRTMLLRLEVKGAIAVARDGGRNLYTPSRSPEEARRSAVSRLMETFFNGSPARTVAAILDESASELPENELEALARAIEEAREAGR